MLRGGAWRAAQVVTRGRGLTPHVRRPAAGTPYEGGLFKMKLCIPADFPAAPPKGTSPRRCAVHKSTS